MSIVVPIALPPRPGRREPSYGFLLNVVPSASGRFSSPFRGPRGRGLEVLLPPSEGLGSGGGSPPPFRGFRVRGRGRFSSPFRGPRVRERGRFSSPFRGPRVRGTSTTGTQTQWTWTDGYLCLGAVRQEGHERPLQRTGEQVFWGSSILASSLCFGDAEGALQAPPGGRAPVFGRTWKKKESNNSGLLCVPIVTRVCTLIQCV